MAQETGMTQVVVRIPSAWIKDLDEIAARMSRPGIEHTRSDILRAAIAQGIQALCKETERKIR